MKLWEQVLRRRRARAGALAFSLLVGAATALAAADLLVRRDGSRSTGQLQACVGEICRWSGAAVPRAEIAWIGLATAGSPPSPRNPQLDAIWPKDGREISSPIVGISLGEVATETDSLDRADVSWIYFGSAAGVPQQQTASPTAAPPPSSIRDRGAVSSSKARPRPRSNLSAAVLAEPEASRKAALAQLKSEDPEARLAALNVLSLTLKAEDSASLAPLLESEDSRERVLAATAMLSLGDGRAVPVLIEALGIEDPLPSGDPPIRVWNQARFALLAFCGQDLGLRGARTTAAAAAAAPAWRKWWEAAEASFKVVRTPKRFGS